MISEPVGSSLNVTGSSSATVSDGLIPGRMPTSVPSITPMPANSRLPGWAATRNALREGGEGGFHRQRRLSRTVARAGRPAGASDNALVKKRYTIARQDDTDADRLDADRRTEAARGQHEQPGRRRDEAAAELQDQHQARKRTQQPGQRTLIVRAVGPCRVGGALAIAPGGEPSALRPAPRRTPPRCASPQPARRPRPGPAAASAPRRTRRRPPASARRRCLPPRPAAGRSRSSCCRARGSLDQSDRGQHVLHAGLVLLEEGRERIGGEVRIVPAARLQHLGPLIGLHGLLDRAQRARPSAPR